jgi:hypothetical protein
MRLCILSANLGNFDKVVEPVEQLLPEGIDSIAYHCFTDSDFPPITGLTPRFQYRIPKFFGWQMFPDYDYFIWLDGSLSFTKEDGAKWFTEQLKNADIAVFKHPWRKTIKEEADHIEDHLQQGKPYITARYKNGLHKEQLKDIQLDKYYEDDHLYASTAFIYRDGEEVRDALRMCWLHQSRYYTCDQLAFTYALKDLAVKVIAENPFKASHLTHVSKHL